MSGVKETIPPDLTLLGLARRSGGVEIGLEATARAARQGRGELLLLARDASPRTRREAVRSAPDVPRLTSATKAALGRALGRGEAGVVLITNPGLAKSLADRLGRNTEVKGTNDARL